MSLCVGTLESKKNPIIQGGNETHAFRRGERKRYAEMKDREGDGRRGWVGLLDSCAALKYLFKLVGFVGSQGLTYGHFIYSFIRFWNFFLKKKKKGSSISCVVLVG